MDQNTIPNWVYKKAKKANLIPGEVYNVYSCQNCFLLVSEDVKRSYEIRYKKVIRNKHHYHVQTCNCSKKGDFITKGKTCIKCNKYFFGKFIHTLPDCPECRKDNGTYEVSQKTKVRSKTKPIIYYQQNKVISTPKIIKTEPSCIHRSNCLNFCYIKWEEFKKAKRRLCCTDCNNVRLMGDL